MDAAGTAGLTTSGVETVEVHTGGGNVLSLGASDANTVEVAAGTATDWLVLEGVGADVDASAYLGTLRVDGQEGVSFEVTTGAAQTEVTSDVGGLPTTVAVDATELANDVLLFVGGSSAFTVTGLQGNLNAFDATGSLTVNTANNASDDDIAIVTGSGETSVTTAGANDTVTVNAFMLAENTSLTLSGASAVAVTSLVGDVGAAGLTGTLTVTTADATDNNIGVTTGSAATSITGTATGDTITVEAAVLDESADLTLAGASHVYATDVKSDVAAASLTGALTVDTADAADDAIRITTGSAATQITGKAVSDTVTVDAAVLAQDTTLTLMDSSAFEVTGLVGNVDARSLVGGLTVTTADAVDNGIAIATGTAATEITGTAADDTVDVNASLLAQNTTLTMAGASTFAVTALVGDVDASGLSGGLTVTTADAIDNAIGVTTGSAATTIDGTAADDTVTVDAAVLADNTALTLSGASAMEVTGLVGDVNASSLTGALTVTTADAPGNTIVVTTGSASTTVDGTGNNDLVAVNAAVLGASETLTLQGASGFVVNDLQGDLAAGASTGDIRVTAIGTQGQTLRTGDGADVLTLGDGDDSATAGAGDDKMYGGAGSDVLRGGEGSDHMYGGPNIASEVNYLLGGGGTGDHALFDGVFDDYRFREGVFDVDVDGNGTVEIGVTGIEMTHRDTGAVTYVNGVENVVFLGNNPATGFDPADPATFGAIEDAATVGRVVLNVGTNARYYTLEDAIAAASDGDTLAIDSGANLSDEGVITVTQEGLTITGDAGVTITGLVMGQDADSTQDVVALYLKGFSTSVTGNNADNVIIGSGADASYRFDGRGGNDTLLGDGGNDVLLGGSGDDLIATTGGDDVIIAGAGNDRVVLSTRDLTGGQDGDVTVMLGSGVDELIVGLIGGSPAGLNISAVIADLQRGTDVLNVGNLEESGGALTLEDIQAAFGTDPRAGTHIDLDAFTVEGGGSVAGDVHLNMVSEDRFVSGDFVFVHDESAPGSWLQDLNSALPL